MVGRFTDDPHDSIEELLAVLVDVPLAIAGNRMFDIHLEASQDIP